jgi:hypothetical protein
MEILVTIGVILALIALAALMIHLINVHRDQRVAAFHYDRFQPGDPPDTGRAGGSAEQAEQGPLPPRDQRREE